MNLSVYLFNTDQGTPESSQLFINAPEKKQVYTLRIVPGSTYATDTIMVDLEDSPLDASMVSLGDKSALDWKAHAEGQRVRLTAPSAKTIAGQLDIALKIAVPATVQGGNTSIWVKAGELRHNLDVTLSRWPELPQSLRDSAELKIEGALLYVTRDGETPRDNTIQITLVNDSADHNLVGASPQEAEFFAFFEYGSRPGQLSPATEGDPRLVASLIRSSVDNTADWDIGRVDERGRGEPGTKAETELPDWCGKPALYWKWKAKTPGVLPPGGEVTFALENIRIRAIPGKDQGRTALFVGWRNLGGINAGTQAFSLKKVLGPGLATLALEPGTPNLTQGPVDAIVRWQVADTGIALQSMLMTRASAPHLIATLHIEQGTQLVRISGPDVLKIMVRDVNGRVSEPELNVATVRQAPVKAYAAPRTVKLHADGSRLLVAADFLRDGFPECGTLQLIDWADPATGLKIFDGAKKTPDGNRLFTSVQQLTASDDLVALYVPTLTALETGDAVPIIAGWLDRDFDRDRGYVRTEPDAMVKLDQLQFWNAKVLEVAVRTTGSCDGQVFFVFTYPGFFRSSTGTVKILESYWPLPRLAGMVCKRDFFWLEPQFLGGKLGGLFQQALVDKVEWRHFAAGKSLLGLRLIPKDPEGIESIFSFGLLGPPASVGIISWDTGAIEGTITLPHDAPQTLTAPADSTRAYVGYTGVNAIDVFDIPKRVLMESIPTNTPAKLLTVSGDGSALFAYSEQDEKITVYRDHRPWLTIAAKGVGCMSASADGRRLAVTQAPEALMLYDLP